MNGGDFISISRMEIIARHGCNECEKLNPQKFLVSADLFLDGSQAATCDDLTKTAHYGHVMKLITSFMIKNSFNLIETLAERLAREILTFSEGGGRPPVERVKVKIEKPAVAAAFNAESVAFTAERRWHSVALALGSNLGDREANLAAAVQYLKADERIKDVRSSSTLKSIPYNVKEQQPDYLNSAVTLKTVCTPLELLDLTEFTEKRLGRDKKSERAPRTIDIDILLFDDLVLRTPRLTIPHYDMENRAFVLSPLAEIAPELIHPLSQKSVYILLAELRRK